MKTNNIRAGDIVYLNKGKIVKYTNSNKEWYNPFTWFKKENIKIPIGIALEPIKRGKAGKILLKGRFSF